MLLSIPPALFPNLATDNVSSHTYIFYKKKLLELQFIEYYLTLRIEFFSGFTNRHPVYPPSSSPIYSNSAYQILAYALESITGRSYASMLQEDLIEKLDLTGTSYAQPSNDALGVIPVSASYSGWDMNIGDEGP